MENFDLQKFNELKQATEQKYKSIGKIYSPALKADIFFNSDGWHHLRYDCSRSERDKRVQQNKFIYFDNAVDIIKKSNTIQEYRRGQQVEGKPDKNGLQKVKRVQWFGMFVVISFSKNMRVKAVIRKVGDDGQYHFWSVMPFWKLTSQGRVVGSKDIEDG